MITFKESSLEELKDIYDTHMVLDFPKNELRSFKQIATLFEKKRYACFLYKEDNQLIGYALFVWKKESVVLLDYFAVISQMRGMGYGSKMMEATSEMSEGRLLLLECESPSKALNHVDKCVQEKRIAFYERNGCKHTGVEVEIADVHYVLMTQENSELDEKELRASLAEIYLSIHPPLAAHI
ncbi:MAG: GNAT family N-acetyltransferase [Vagococcus sp.]